MCFQEASMIQFPPRIFATALALATVLWAIVAPAQECGDVNESGSVTSVDALLVLNKSVGLDVDLTCPRADTTELEARIAVLE
jgi:hypothetical protein